MKIICTICSRQKKEDAELLAAEDRYTGEHIFKVKKISKESNTPFYILSGKYGLISGSTPIPYYDYYLQESAVNALIEIVTSQIKDGDITELEFYSEAKESWAPYKKVIETAAKRTEIILHPHNLD